MIYVLFQTHGVPLGGFPFFFKVLSVNILSHCICFPALEFPAGYFFHLPLSFFVFFFCSHSFHFSIGDTVLLTFWKQPLVFRVVHSSLSIPDKVDIKYVIRLVSVGCFIPWLPHFLAIYFILCSSH